MVEEQPRMQQALRIRLPQVPESGYRDGVEPSAEHPVQPRRDHLGIAEAHIRHVVLHAHRLPHGVGGGLVHVAHAGIGLGDDHVGHGHLRRQRRTRQTPPRAQGGFPSITVLDHGGHLDLRAARSRHLDGDLSEPRSTIRLP